MHKTALDTLAPNCFRFQTSLVMQVQAWFGMRSCSVWHFGTVTKGFTLGILLFCEDLH
jgi:hypothetical protein